MEYTKTFQQYEYISEVKKHKCYRATTNQKCFSQWSEF